MSIRHEQTQQISQEDVTRASEAAGEERRGYAVKHSERLRPMLSLNEFRGPNRARSLQLGWVGLSRPGPR